MSQCETLFKQKVLKDLHSLPSVWVIKTQQRTQRGIPDLLVCWRGRFIAIELKIDGEVPTTLQALNIQWIRDAGGSAFSATPESWPEQFAHLKKGR